MVKRIQEIMDENDLETNVSRMQDVPNTIDAMKWPNAVAESEDLSERFEIVSQRLDAMHRVKMFPSLLQSEYPLLASIYSSSTYIDQLRIATVMEFNYIISTYIELINVRSQRIFRNSPTTRTLTPQFQTLRSELLVEVSSEDYF